MRLPLRLGAAVLFILLALPASGRAQSAVPNDPFTIYYGYVVPRQNQQELDRLNAVQQRAMANIAAQEQIQADRSEFLERSLRELSDPQSQQRGFRPSARFDRSAISLGTGPAAYYDNTRNPGLRIPTRFPSYYPDRRTGRGLHGSYSRRR